MVESSFKNRILNITVGVAMSFAFTLISLFFLSIILTYSNISESIEEPAVIVISGISIFVGSSIGNFRLQKNGLINGGIIGAVYIFVMYLISSCVSNNFIFSNEAIILAIIAIAFGILGGIIGVNCFSTKNSGLIR
jgi:putative membrane protein (TIGR04086 family)